MENVFWEVLEGVEECFQSVDAIFHKSTTIFINDFWHTKIFKSEKIWVMSRAAKFLHNIDMRGLWFLTNIAVMRELDLSDNFHTGRIMAGCVFYALLWNICRSTGRSRDRDDLNCNLSFRVSNSLRFHHIRVAAWIGARTSRHNHPVAYHSPNSRRTQMVSYRHCKWLPY